jgi:glycosyltransferase involved in cell wall biosynthesis
MLRKRVAIIGGVGIPASYGGFETLTEQLVKNLSIEHEITVYCSSKHYKFRPSHYLGASLHYIPLRANGWQAIFYDIWSILHSFRKNDTLLVLGVTGCIILPFISFFKVKTIVHIDGLEWKRDKWKFLAKYFLRFSESIAMRFASEIVLDNEGMVDVVTSIYKRRSFQLITYGSETENTGYECHYENGLIPKEKYALAVCRIVPENNVKHILDAFSDERIGIRLLFVGNWQVNEYSQKLYEIHKDTKNLSLLDSIYDQTKIEALRKRCEIYIHGHSAGGTNPSLVEAMRSGIPIVAKDVVFNRVTMKSKGLYFIDANDLMQIIVNRGDFDLKTIAHDLFLIAQKEYCWESITRQYSALFSHLPIGREVENKDFSASHSYASLR